MRVNPNLVALAFVLGITGGCRPEIRDGGEDLDFLKDHQEKQDVVSAKQLLPLDVGNYWDMTISSDRQSVSERLIVVGPVQVGNELGVQVNILRGSKLWRLEVYQNSSKGLQLVAFGQSQANLLVLHPPFPITQPDVKLKTALTWKGNIILQGKSYPATGYSRVTSKDTLTTGTGRSIAYRIDSVVTMQQADGPLHFPNVRWLAPNIGFVRRGYADNGLPAISEMERFMTKGTP